MEKETQALHSAYPQKDPYGSLSMPVYHVAAYEFDNADLMSDAFCGRVMMPDYSRVMNPTVMHLEDKVKALTGASDVIAFTSGMAAISNTFLAICSAGKNIVTSRHLFGNTYVLLDKTLRKFGVETRFCDLTDIKSVEANIDENTCCLYLEIITNPQMEIADLRSLGELARRKGIPMVADTTMIPFTHFKARELGIDIEIVSSTKYLSGGATSLGGLIIDYGTAKGFNEKIRFELLFNLGAYMTPHAAYMQTLGLETLMVRYEKQAANALELSTRLKEVPGICRVNYPGLPDNPYHGLSKSQFGETAGAMLTIDLKSEQTCKDFINGLKLIKRATNLFDNKTLAIHPYSTIFGNLTAEEKSAMDVYPTTVRLSVGLENVNDLFDDVVQALESTSA